MSLISVAAVDNCKFVHFVILSFLDFFALVIVKVLADTFIICLAASQ